MTQGERDKLVARIIAGVIPLSFYFHPHERRYEYRKPSREDCLLVEEMGEEALRDAELDGLMLENELESYLHERGFWDEARERSLREIPRDIEKLKVGLFEHRDRKSERESIRRTLRNAKEKLGELFAERHAHDILSCSGYAKLVKLKAKLALGLHHRGKRVFEGLDYLEDRTDLLDTALVAWQSSQLDEATYRELARTPPWRGVWQCRDVSPSLFGTPACDLTDEQQQLIAVSSLYENVRAHPECPNESVLEDDDMLDGWLLIQHREQNKQQNERDIEGGIRSEKIRGAQEVFVMVEDKEKAEAVNSLNSPQAQAVIKKRHEAIQKHGAVSQQNLPDIKAAVQQEFNRRSMGG